jgi:hypothetical protein
MSDATTDAPPGEQTEEDVDPAAAISRGVGLRLDAIPAGSDAEKAVEAFKENVTRYAAAEAEFEAAKAERNQMLFDLKSTHNVGFTAIGELIGGTSSLALYLYERAQGKSAKQIREESVASRKAKELTRETDPDRKPARKQTPAEKEFRKSQREALRAFLDEQKRLAAERGESTDEQDQALADVDQEEADDAQE